MAREARLFESVKGSPARALFKLRGNIPPAWIERARVSRKHVEPDVVQAMKRLQKLRRTRPAAKVLIRAAEQELKMLLREWEVAYRKEAFYNSRRALLEMSRNGSTKR